MGIKQTRDMKSKIRAEVFGDDKKKVRKRAVGDPDGRPKTTVNDLPKNWNERMLRCAKNGGSQTKLLVELGIGKSAFNTLLETSANFRSVFEQCLLLQKLWYEDAGKKMIKGAKGNAAVWSMCMTNHFNWRSKRDEIIGDENAPMQHSIQNKDLTYEELKDIAKERGLPTTIFDELKK